jgi:hypothetical protein
MGPVVSSFLRVGDPDQCLGIRSQGPKTPAGCSQHDFETLRFMQCWTSSLSNYASVSAGCSLKFQRINAGQFILLVVDLAISPMRRVPILADLAQISDPFIATGLKRPEIPDPRPLFCNSCMLALHLSKYRVGSALSGQFLLCSHVLFETGVEKG